MFEVHLCSWPTADRRPWAFLTFLDILFSTVLPVGIFFGGGGGGTPVA